MRHLLKNSWAQFGRYTGPTIHKIFRLLQALYLDLTLDPEVEGFIPHWIVGVSHSFSAELLTCRSWQPQQHIAISLADWVGKEAKQLLMWQSQCGCMTLERLQHGNIKCELFKGRMPDVVSLFSRYPSEREKAQAMRWPRWGGGLYSYLCALQTSAVLCIKEKNEDYLFQSATFFCFSTNKLSCTHVCMCTHANLQLMSYEWSLGLYSTFWEKPQ